MTTTENPPSYQGRSLPRPQDDVEDQGLAFDVVTLLDRRRVLKAAGLSTAAAFLAACTRTSGVTTSTTSGLTEIPDETAGPYPGDGSNGVDVLEESGIVRGDIRSSFGTGSMTAQGVPMELTLTVLDLANGGAPFAGAAVYVWHCDREGRYSMYSDGLESENYLRGVQVADASGRVTFTSVFPACYSGRWPHIHFEVYPDVSSISDVSNVIATSQVALPQDVCEEVYVTTGYEDSVENLSQVSLESDGVFGDDAGASQLGNVTGTAATGFVVTLTAAVDATTEPSQGSMPGGQGAGPGGGNRPSGPPPSR